MFAVTNYFDNFSESWVISTCNRNLQESFHREKHNFKVITP